MPDRYGASPEQWRRWIDLGLTADLLPVVSNPHAEISGRSTMRALGKTPSLYNHERKVVGIADWTQRQTTEKEVSRWAKEPDYGICVQTRRLRAIDVDVEDEALAQVVRSLVEHQFSNPARVRKGSGKFLMPFWMEDGALPKHVIPVAGGMIEILGDGQQFIAEGLHTSGSHYAWTGQLEAIPTLDEVDFAMLLAEMKTIATGEVKIARQRRELNGSAALVLDDDVATWLIDNWETYDAGSDGQIFIACPFADEHSSDTGPSSTAYFPAGTGGYAQGNFICLHAHCTGRDQAEFLNATGYVRGAFETLEEDRALQLPAEQAPRTGPEADLPSGRPDDRGEDRRSRQAGANAEGPGGGGHDNLSRSGVDDQRARRQLAIAQERWPALTRDSASRIEPTMNNLILALGSPAMMGRHIAWDAFKDMLVTADGAQPFHLAQWRSFRDTDYALVRQHLEVKGFKPMGMELLKLAILAVAEANTFDAARDWLGRLVWDGEERIDAFCHRGWGWADTPYARAVGRYTWTALAGRIMQPGVQADMAPILVGPQGALKTSAIKAMSPDPEFYASVKLDAHDADTSRLLRGTLIAELEELRGLNSRAVEEIKAWITKTHEKWVPKYREFASTYGRRNLFFGSTNEEEFLADPTGERRWLPGKLTRADPDWIARHREQLWAEGASVFLLDGVDWSEAEALAKVEHGAFKMSDPWEPYVAYWLKEGAMDVGGDKPCDRDWLTTSDVLSGAVHIPASQIDRGKEIRAGKIMKSLGWHRRRVLVGEDRIWAYARSE
jgi:predicted P-loop ATPase